jgi:ethanolamine utilization protein EutA (predicted chaperonin)
LFLSFAFPLRGFCFIWLLRYIAISAIITLKEGGDNMQLENALSENEVKMLLEPMANYATVTIDYCFPLKYEVKMKLLNSIMDKIENLNPLVVFTKQEYSVMLAALIYYEDVADDSVLTQDFYKLMKKIKSKTY